MNMAKNRNIRYSIFVLNGVINSSQKKESKPVDIQFFDIAKCFDTLWLSEVMNDLYEAGMCNDKFELLYLQNETANVAVKTLFSLTDRFHVKNTVMQGTLFGGLQCTVQMDKIGQKSYKRGKSLYNYNKTAKIPILGMVDDLLSISACGPQSVITNSEVNSFIESKQLELGHKKCHKMHIGKN